MASKLACACFFIAGGAFLLLHGGGMLLWPGVFASGLGLFLILTGRFGLASSVGSLAAGASFALQGFWGVCPLCVVTAALFGVGAVACSLAVFKEKPFAVLGLSPLLLGMAVFAAASFGHVAGVEPGVAADSNLASSMEKPGATEISSGGARGVAEGSIGSGMPGNAETHGITGSPRAKLYFSPWCSHCKEPLAEMARVDPEGRRWVPVVVPCLAFEKGKKELKDLGYTGKLECVGRSPTGVLPTLEIDGRVYPGSEDILSEIKRRF